MNIIYHGLGKATILVPKKEFEFFDLYRRELWLNLKSSHNEGCKNE